MGEGFPGIVVHNGENFSVGANIGLPFAANVGAGP
jgi:hypothetical protein